MRTEHPILSLGAALSMLKEAIFNATAEEEEIEVPKHSAAVIDRMTGFGEEKRLG